MRYKTVLFDVDGVMLSENTYFNATAQTVHELVETSIYLGESPQEPNPDSQRTAEIRSRVLGTHDDVLDFLKGRGVNSNWDMTYLLVVHTLLKNLARAKEQSWVSELCERGITLADFAVIREKIQVVPAYSEFTRDFPERLAKHEFLLYLNQLVREWIGADTDSFGRSSQLWEETRLIFQEFYLGDGKAKPGYLQREEAIIPVDELIVLLSELREKRIDLGIATGRPRQETIIPLTEMGVLDYIPEERIATASSVLEAEAAVPAARPLAKPHPYSYLRALRGAASPINELLQENLPLEAREVLIVGDSLADLLAAKALGSSFAAVLTGHEGERARGMFEQHGADHILKHVGELRTLFND